MSHDPLDIPDFLRRKDKLAPPAAQRRSPTRDWVIPPVALGPVARAVRAGCDTTQRIRKRAHGRYSDAEIRKALDALVRSGDVTRVGRRYTSNRHPSKP